LSPAALSSATAPRSVAVVSLSPGTPCRCSSEF
jgi:hypothetical protein